MRLGILSSHPIQYYAPLFRGLAQRMDVEVLYAHRATPQQQAAAGFGTAFDWDVDLLSGYSHRFLRNVSRVPGTQTYSGCDTPDVGQILRAARYDAVLAMGWHLKSFIQGILAAKRAGLPVLIRGDSHLHTQRHALKRLVKEMGYPVLLRTFDAALYVGTRNREYYEHFRYPPARLFHVPHCVDTRWFSDRATKAAGQALRAEVGIAPEADVVLFAGKFVPFKRPLDVVEAVATVAQTRPVSLLLAGSGPLRSEMHSRARVLGIRCHDLGFCNQSRMPAVYSASQVLALPSNSQETWGLVCNEAIACGTPIVVSDAVGCAPDLAADAGGGRVFPLGNLVSFAAAIHDTLARPRSIAALRRVTEVHSIEAAVRGIEQALSTVVGHIT